MNPDTGNAENQKKTDLLTDLADGALASRWKSGEEAAAAVLLDRYSARLVALVASRLGSRYRSTVDPEEVVQSAWGSFFDATRHSRVDVSMNVSLWRLLATFVRRKMARRIEQLQSLKRGGGHNRVTGDLDQLKGAMSTEPFDNEVNEFWGSIRAQLPAELADLLQALMEGQTQVQAAATLNVDERTVRRRMKSLRQHLTDIDDCRKPPGSGSADEQPMEPCLSLPNVSYREFVLGTLIGAGGFGKVYRARMQSSDEMVAVKFLRKAFWQDRAAGATLLREVDAAAEIDHPGIVKYCGYGISPHGGPYILSEWIDAVTLDRRAELTTPRFEAILRQICDALLAVHRAGIVHGDITPRNILVGHDDHVVITDFGFSARYTRRQRSSVSGGTLGFAAPEQLFPAFGNVDNRTDIYAIGGLVAWFLTGHEPNRGASTGEAVFTTLSDRELPVSGVVSEVTRLADLANACLRPYPSERIGSVEQVISRLNASGKVQCKP